MMISDEAQDLASQTEAALEFVDPNKCRRAAHAWADDAIKNYRGSLLRAAMDVAVALADFAAELDGPEGP